VEIACAAACDEVSGIITEGLALGVVDLVGLACADLRAGAPVSWAPLIHVELAGTGMLFQVGQQHTATDVTPCCG
jgi:hypothetical protein